VFKAGSKIGRYKVVGPVGRGKPDGLFEVDDPDGRRFALRSPIADLEDGDANGVSRRFMGDVESLKAIAHINLVPIFDVFVEQGYVCIVVERVRGRTLASQISHGQLDPRESLMIARQIMEGTAAAHSSGRVHRDLRPSKILLVPMEGWDLVKIADFGLGTLRDDAVLEYGAGALTGSVRTAVANYMAPEQVRERSVDARTDFYAIGTILFEMLAGRPPFPDRDPEHVKRQQLTIPPPRLGELFPGEPWVTREMKTLVETSLAKEREERYTSAHQMIAAIEAAYRSIA
jgi:serine/threonine-protein kinase